MEDDEEEVDDVLEIEESDDDEEEVYEVPVDDIIDTGTVYPEDSSTLEDVEDYYGKFNEIEEAEDELKAELEEDVENEEEIQTEINILENKEDYYAQLTDGEDTSEEGDLDWMDSDASSDDDDDLSWIDVEVPPDDDVLEIEESDDDEGDDYSGQDVIDAIIAGSDDSGADPDMGMGYAVIEEDDAPDITSESDDSTEQPESKLKTDERIKQMDGEDDEEKENENTDLFKYIFEGNSR